MSQQQTPVFHELQVVESRNETRELAHIAVAAPIEFLADYQIPGQYVQIKQGEHKPGFFAIACAPNKKRLEFLIKRGTPLADYIADRNVNDTLMIAPPAGKGYPMAEARGHDLFLVGVGSGIAPLRAVVQAVLTDRSAYKRVRLIYGNRAPQSFPYQLDLVSWPQQGVEVTAVCSRPAEGSWFGHIGYVQHVLLRVKPVIAENSAVFVCGMKPMIEDVKSAFRELGLLHERVYQNF